MTFALVSNASAVLHIQFGIQRKQVKRVIRRSVGPATGWMRFEVLQLRPPTPRNRLFCFS